MLQIVDNFQIKYNFMFTYSTDNLRQIILNIVNEENNLTYKQDRK